MSRESPNGRLRQEIQRLEKMLEEGDQRIKAFYREDIEPPEDYPDLEDPPHRSMMKRGIELIKFASTELHEDLVVFPSTEYEIEVLLYGVGMESLLNGVHLKVDTDGFIDYMEREPGRTPSFGSSKDKVLEVLESRLKAEERERLELILDWILKHRNNEVHLAFHRHRSSYLERLIMEVALRLYQYFSEEELSECGSLKEEISRLKEIGQHSLSSEIKFDPDGLQS